MITAFQNIARIEELRKRILFTAAMLAVYRVGCIVVTPGINGNVIRQFFSDMSGTMFGLLNVFSGGAMESLSIFALGIMPYISASIIFQLLTVVIPALERLKKEGKIRHYAISTNDLPSLQALNATGGCASCQINYSILERDAEKDILPYCLENDIGVLLRGPLSKGVLAGKFTKETRFEDSVRARWNEGEQHAAFPDYHHTVIDRAIDRAAGKALLLYHVTGTFRAPYGGHAPTGKRLDCNAMDLLTVGDGRIVLCHGMFDRLGMYEQLGIL